MQLYLEVEAVETILRNMLLTAFDDDYIQAMRDANDVINISIPKIMDYLIRLYGTIKPEELRALKLEVEDYIYDPLLPIDVLFNKLDFFSDLTDFAKKPLSDSDKIDIIYIILNRCGVFKDSLKEWNKKDDRDLDVLHGKTYNNMRNFFSVKNIYNLIKSMPCYNKNLP